MKKQWYFLVEGKWHSLEFIYDHYVKYPRPFEYLVDPNHKFTMRTWENPITGDMFFNFHWDQVYYNPEEELNVERFRAAARNTRFRFLRKGQILKLFEEFGVQNVLTKILYIAKRIGVYDAGERIRNLYAYLRKCMRNMLDQARERPEKPYETHDPKEAWTRRWADIEGYGHEDIRKSRDFVYPRHPQIYQKVKQFCYCTARELYREIGLIMFGREQGERLSGTLYRVFGIEEEYADFKFLNRISISAEGY